MTAAKLLTYKGKTQTITEWADELGMPRTMIVKRLARGWTDEDALSCEDKHLAFDEGDPQCLANLAIHLNTSVLDRIEKNMPQIHSWIDEQCKADPEKALRLADKMSAIFDRFAKHAPKTQQVERAMVNISLNSTARPDIVIDAN